MVDGHGVLNPEEVAVHLKVPGNLSPERTRQAYFSIGEFANRWRCSRGTVYNRLRAAGAEVLDFAAPGKKGKKAVSAKVVLRIESRKTKRLA